MVARGRSGAGRPLLFCRVQAARTGGLWKDLQACLRPAAHRRGDPEVVRPRRHRRRRRRRHQRRGELGRPLGSTWFYPIFETAEAIRDAYSIAMASSPHRLHGRRGVALRRHPSGAGLPLDARRARRRSGLRSKLLVDARAAGIRYPISGMWGGANDDLDGLRRFATELRDLGYYGMMLGNPDHIPLVHELFTPSRRRDRLLGRARPTRRRGGPDRRGTRPLRRPEPGRGPRRARRSRRVRPAQPRVGSGAGARAQPVGTKSVRGIHERNRNGCHRSGRRPPLGRRRDRCRLRRSLPTPATAADGLLRDGARDGRRGRRDLVLEPLPRRTGRRGRCRVLVQLLPRDRAGVGVERGDADPTRDRAVSELRNRPLGPAARHPVRDEGHGGDVRRCGRRMDGGDRPRRTSRQPVRGGGHRLPIRPARAGHRGNGLVRRGEPVHQPLPHGGLRLHRPARRGYRHRVLRRAGDSRHCRTGKPSPRLPTFRGLCPAGQQPSVVARRDGARSRPGTRTSGGASGSRSAGC